MATYKQIQGYVNEQNGSDVETCHIAHVLADHGLTNRRAPNRIDPLTRVKPCPPKKRRAIEEALKHFRMVK